MPGVFYGITRITAHERLIHDGNTVIILASASPRRAELLKQIGILFKTDIADIDESRRDNESPENLVHRLANAKAAAVAERHPEAIVLGSDTAVIQGNHVFGKPDDRDQGIAMLMALSGRTHQVLTGVAVVTQQQALYRLSRTAVRFRNIGSTEAAAYWDSGEPQDKAGCYAIQGYGAIFVDEIRGSYSGVMGLPLFETAVLLEQVGQAVLPR